MANKLSFDSGIEVDFIGDSGPFSRTGKSICYRLTVRGVGYLLDIGGPVFNALGPEGIDKIRGAFVTHSHEDHRRWFTDVALYMKYSPAVHHRLRLITTTAVHEEWEKDSRAALMRTLTGDSRQVIDLPYDAFVEKVLLGPRSRYRIDLVPEKANSRARHWGVLDERNQPVDPKIAKVVIHRNPSANRPRLLFRDPKADEWVEPEYYYIFEDQRFYHAEQNNYVDKEIGLTVRPIKGPAWHGPSIFSVEFTNGRQRLLFSSDTVYDVSLWHALAQEKREQKLPMSRREFEETPILYGDINDYVERTWSPERLEQALGAYKGGCIVHDADYEGSVVHTSYSNLASLPRERFLLTHSPDQFVSKIPLARDKKTFFFGNDSIYEVCRKHGKKEIKPYNADLFVKKFSRFYVGFESSRGKYPLVRRNENLDVPLDADAGGEEVLGRYDLYVDIDGRYLPMLEDPASQRYERRLDGQIELVEETAEGSRARVVADLRDGLTQRVLTRDAPARKKAKPPRRMVARRNA